MGRISFKINKPEYCILQVFPHTSNRNNSSSIIAKTVAESYRGILKSIKVNFKGIEISQQNKVMFIVDMSKEDISFYFVVPISMKKIYIEKIQEVWNKSLIKEAELPNITGSNIVTYGMEFMNLDAFSLKVDKRCNTTLNNLFEVIESFEGGDKARIVYNFTPTSQYSWKADCRRAHNKFLSNAPITKEIGAGTIVLVIANSIIQVADSILKAFSTDIRENSFMADIRDMMVNAKKKLNDATINKSVTPMISTQIAIISSSDNSNRATNNAISICGAYRSIDHDNLLLGKKKRLQGDLKQFKLGGIPSMKTSIDECQNFLQLPARELLEKYKITHKNVNEVIVDEEITKGYIRAGKTTYKSSVIQTYFPTEIDLSSQPRAFVGPMGCGKTFQNLQYAKDVIEAGESLIVIDYIDKCQLSESIKQITPKDRLIDIDLSKEENLQSFAFNEFTISSKDRPFEKMEKVSAHQQEILALLDAVAINGEQGKLTGQMRKFLTSACDICLIHNGTSLKDVIRCLEDYEYRQTMYQRIPDDMKGYLGSQLRILDQLDDHDKKQTRYSKVEHIIDRVNIMCESLRMRIMYDKAPENNIDFMKAMNSGKVILIRMRSDVFKSEHQRNVLTTFFISKIWLACNMRTEHKKCHVLLDEIFQAPTSYKSLMLILKQCRKFRLVLVFTAHLLADLGDLLNGLKSAGTSYIFMQKCPKDNFFLFEEEFKRYGFELDDLLHLQKRHSLNMISTSKGYCIYEADLTINE